MESNPLAVLPHTGKAGDGDLAAQLVRQLSCGPPTLAVSMVLDCRLCATIAPRHSQENPRSEVRVPLSLSVAAAVVPSHLVKAEPAPSQTMACEVLVDPRQDFPGWLAARGMNPRYATALETELGITDYDSLLACARHPTVRGELFTLARERLPFAFYAVLRQVLEGFGADGLGCGAAAAPSALADTLQAIVSMLNGLSQELQTSAQRFSCIYTDAVHGEEPQNTEERVGSEEEQSLPGEAGEAGGSPASNPAWHHGHGKARGSQRRAVARAEDVTSQKPHVSGWTGIKIEQDGRWRGENEGVSGEDGRYFLPEVHQEDRKVAVMEQPSHVESSHGYLGNLDDGNCGYSGEVSGNDFAGGGGNGRFPQQQQQQPQQQQQQQHQQHPGQKKARKVRRNWSTNLGAPLQQQQQADEATATAYPDHDDLPGGVAGGTAEELCFGRADQEPLPFLRKDDRPGPPAKPVRRKNARKGLSRKLSAVDGKEAFRCQDCGKEFSQRSHLMVHVRKHTGERPFACEECGKRFSQSFCLARHRRMHTGEKPFACTECGMTFKLKHHLRRHQKTHSGEKLFICEECGIGFSHIGTLAQHYRSHGRGATAEDGERAERASPPTLQKSTGSAVEMPAATAAMQESEPMSAVFDRRDMGLEYGRHEHAMHGSMMPEAFGMAQGFGSHMNEIPSSSLQGSCNQN
ncbi:uncharacterized protein LOC116943803 isoform X2 [Petromyzon marinus]|uniref:Uncharacterized protein LOC116943803 isoform X2 n=1 Tax=Petromyzon marinus TaxID=7757 RepID=A0AAJ7T7Y8_PETMA|nr:uncharacterized protein LOC116943803 isoform X2 [Petromyzon marinus]